LATADPLTDDERAIAITCANVGEIDIVDLAARIKGRRSSTLMTVDSAKPGR